MRKIFIIAAGLAMFATSAWAQSSSRDRDDYYGGSWRERSGGWDRNADDQRGRPMRGDDERRPGRGASFDLKSGETQIRVNCDGQESMRACVDATLSLFDKVQSQARPSSSSAPVSPPASQ
jgi:hypothetical protein